MRKRVEGSGREILEEEGGRAKRRTEDTLRDRTERMKERISKGDHRERFHTELNSPRSTVRIRRAERKDG